MYRYQYKMSILNLSYNQLGSHLVVGTDNGYIVYSLTPNIEKKMHVEKEGGVGLVKMLYRTNCLLLVGGGVNPFAPVTKVILWDDYRKSNIIEFDLKKPIRNAFIDNDNIIVIVLQKEIFLFKFEGSLISTRSTYSNDNGLCNITVDNSNKATIVTLGMKKGEVAIWRPHQDSCKCIQAHSSNIEAIAINKDATMIATGSEIGTIIRVFNTETCKQIYEFRRGTKSAKIYNITFNKDSTILACCSSNGTIHIFELYKDINTTKNTSSSLVGLKDYVSYFGSQWGFKQIYIDSTAKMICSFDENNVLHISCIDGKYYRISGPNFDVIKQSNLHIDTK